MNKWQLLIHIILVIVLSLVVVYIVSLDICPSPGDYISGVGSVASLYGIVIALWQLKQVKSAANAAKDAVETKMKEIDSFLTFADTKRHIEICNSLNLYLSRKEYEAAAIRLEQLREVLVNLKHSKDLSNNEMNSASIHTLNLGTDILSLRKHLAGTAKLNLGVVFLHVSNVCDFLENVSSKIKQNNYDKGQV